MKERKDFPTLKAIVPDAATGGDAVDAMRKAAKRARAEGTAISLQFARIIEGWLAKYAIPEYSDQRDEPDVVAPDEEGGESTCYHRDKTLVLIVSPAQAKAYRELGYDQPVEETPLEIEGEM